ncbi:MAG TPA: hypothetical protein VF789_02715 [Thermoanaerobaculia bacterium]
MRSRLTFHPMVLCALLLGLALTLPACRHSPKSDHSYDQIRALVAGKSASEIEHLLGEPDARENVLDEQRWIWWNYTFLDGDQYAPEIRGQVVHLEIILKNPAASGAAIPVAQWRVTGPLSVSYSMPSRSH